MYAPVTLHQAVEYLQRAVADYGLTYVDPHAGPDVACRYFYDEHNLAAVPDRDFYVGRRCIVGQALSYHGVSDDDMYRVRCGASVLFNLIDLDVDPDAVALFRRAQREQDDGAPWGSAVIKALAGLADSV